MIVVLFFVLFVVFHVLHFLTLVHFCLELGGPGWRICCCGSVVSIVRQSYYLWQVRKQLL